LRLPRAMDNHWAFSPHKLGFDTPLLFVYYFILVSDKTPKRDFFRLKPFINRVSCSLFKKVSPLSNCQYLRLGAL
ncbi:hypothetical protein, partial [Prevotellamassilia timonensis]|uniref:hypothetical protein n=1 Tax=Prevotellamassilia timonensis TaxID=1852370 RepID=UPI00307A1A98